MSSSTAADTLFFLVLEDPLNHRISKSVLDSTSEAAEEPGGAPQIRGNQEGVLKRLSKEGGYDKERLKTCLRRIEQGKAELTP